MNNLQESVKTLWTLHSFIWVFIITGALFLTESIAGKDSIFPLMYPVTSIAFFTLGSVWAIAIPRLRYKFWSFEVREREIILQRGILTRVKTVAPITRIQHTDVSQGPLERMFDLAHLSLYTAGTRGADVVIPGLPIIYAEQLREYLKNYVMEDSV